MYNRKYSYQVIIIGGGPAGNAAAQHLAENGVRTAVIDSREQLGNKLCTGIIGLECAGLIKPDPTLIYRDAFKVTVHGPDDETYDLQDANNHAFIIDRVGYVDAMASSAMTLGAKYLVGHKVIDLKINAESVLVTTVSSEGSNSILAEVVIIASGFGTSLLTMVGLEKHKRGEYLVGAQIVVKSPNIDHIHLFTGKTFVPGFFGWLVPTAGDNALLGGVYRKYYSDQFREFVKNMIGQSMVSDPQSSIGCWGIPVKPLKKTFSHRTLVIGDAAGFAKPTTGGGIYYAILSGLLAAKTILSSYRNFEAEQMAQYETLWKNKFGRELKMGYYARLLYESLDEKSLSILLEKFASPEIQLQLLSDNDFSFDWHGSTIRKTLLNPEIIKILNSLGPRSLGILGKMLKAVLY